MENTHYEVLGISPDATQDKIKNAYRVQAMKWHPDKNHGSKESEDHFKRIAAAYATLSDPASRVQYDAVINHGIGDDNSFVSTINENIAESIFYREMVLMAVELTYSNIPWSRIATALVNKGCPGSIANKIARSVQSERQTAVRSAATRAFLWAIGWIALGGIITAASYSNAKQGGSYVITTGLFLFGGINLLRALYYLISGRAPS